MQSAFRPAGTACAACSPSSSTQMTSPGRTSRTASAPMRSSAHVSEATTQSSPIWPSVSGRNPNGSRNATRVPVHESRHRVGALQARHRGCHRFGERRLVARDERGDDLRVQPCRELDAVADQLGSQLLDVHEIAVVPERDGARSRRDGSAAARSPTCWRPSSSSGCGRSPPRPAVPAAAARRRRARRGPSPARP